jgi:N-acetyl-anhydromuramyl-L-alanine amidase AmpD
MYRHFVKPNGDKTGNMLIISNFEFENPQIWSTRHGTKEDVANLKHVFNQYGYKIRPTKEDLEADVCVFQIHFIKSNLGDIT